MLDHKGSIFQQFLSKLCLIMLFSTRNFLRYLLINKLFFVQHLAQESHGIYPENCHYSITKKGFIISPTLQYPEYSILKEQLLGTFKLKATIIIH